jgi:hypothetical protein
MEQRVSSDGATKMNAEKARGRERESESGFAASLLERENEREGGLRGERR